MTLLEAAKAAAKWMKEWLDENSCDCESEGHVCGRPARIRELGEIDDAINEATDKHLAKTHSDPEDDRCDLAWDLHCARHHKKEREIDAKWRAMLFMMERVAAAHPCDNPHCSCREIRPKLDAELKKE